jgi:hypothetical protein
MGNKINISSKGGSVSIGTVVQGDHNQVGNTVSPEMLEQALARARAEVARLVPSGARGTEAAMTVAEHLRALGEEVKQPNPSTENGLSILRTIRENFSWAYPAIKELAQAVWPALLSLG